MSPHSIPQQQACLLILCQQLIRLCQLYWLPVVWVLTHHCDYYSHWRLTGHTSKAIHPESRAAKSQGILARSLHSDSRVADVQGTLASSCIPAARLQMSQATGAPHIPLDTLPNTQRV